MPQMCPNCSHDNPGKQATGSCGNCGAMLRGLLGFGERIDGYEAQKVLGCGGFSAVYLAKDLKHNHDVALKELFGLDDEDTKRFEHEAAILRRLSHPQLPRFYEHFEHEGKRYLVMEFIPGQSLHDIVVEKQESGEKVRDVVAFGWALQLCDAVAYLHKERIIHRDIKPDNVRLTPIGEICLVDLGIAKSISPNGRSDTVVHGLTPGYAPIEQYPTRASGYQGRTDERTDIYALGATLYTVATNLTPPDARALAAGTETLPRIQAIHPQISNQFAMTIERAMELKPEHRFASVVDMKRALERKTLPYPDLQELDTVSSPVEEIKPTSLNSGRIDSKDLAATSSRRRLWLLALIPLLLVVWYVAINYLPGQSTPKFSIAFEDDFSDTSGWPVESQANHQMWYENGEYHALVKDTWLTFPTVRRDIYTDFILEVDAGQVSGSDKNLYGLIFRYQDSDNYYALLVSSEGRYGLVKLLASRWTFLEGDYIASPYIKKGSSTNHLQVIAQGSQITVLINGQQVTSISDTSFAKGQVGIAFGSFDEPNVHVRFDNFRVKE